MARAQDCSTAEVFSHLPVPGTSLVCIICRLCGSRLGFSSRPEVVALVESIHARYRHYLNTQLGLGLEEANQQKDKGDQIRALSKCQVNPRGAAHA